MFGPYFMGYEKRGMLSWTIAVMVIILAFLGSFFIPFFIFNFGLLLKLLLGPAFMALGALVIIFFAGLIFAGIKSATSLWRKDMPRQNHSSSNIATVQKSVTSCFGGKELTAQCIEIIRLNGPKPDKCFGSETAIYCKRCFHKLVKRKMPGKTDEEIERFIAKNVKKGTIPNLLESLLNN